MAAVMVQLVGGQFQDAEGNPLSGGKLTLELSQDAAVNDSQIAAGIVVDVYLDSAGSAINSPGQFAWGNDVLSPINTYYKVTGYTAEGQTAWGPNNQQIVGSGIFDLGTWTPNTVISWFPPVQPPPQVTLEVNSAPASSQVLQNLVEGSNITITDEGNGAIEISASSSSVVAPRSIWTGNEFAVQLTYQANTGPGGNAGDVWTYPFNLSVATIIGHISQAVYGGPYGGGGGHFSCAIYSLDGLTKLVDAGAAAFSGLVSGMQTVAITPVTLPAGAYRFAFSCEDATLEYVYGVAISDSPNVWNLVGSPLVAKCGNPSVGAQMPATLGTFTANTNIGWPSFLLQP